MAVTKKEAEHIAHLARLKFSEGELENIAKDMNNVLSYVEELQKVDVKDTKITVNPIYIENRVREDEVKDEIDTKLFLQNAPETMEEYLVVPQVVGGEEGEN